MRWDVGADGDGLCVRQELRLGKRNFMGSVGLERYGMYVESCCVVESRTDHTVCYPSRYILLLFNTHIDCTIPG